MPTTEMPKAYDPTDLEDHWAEYWVRENLFAQPTPAADEAKEDKRAVYISVDLGFTRADVGGLSDNTGFDKKAANGLLAGLGLGYRHQDFRFGAVNAILGGAAVGYCLPLDAEGRGGGVREIVRPSCTSSGR